MDLVSPLPSRAFLWTTGLGALLAMLLGRLVAAEVPQKISPAVRSEAGVLTHEVECPFQAGTTTIRVLLPDAGNPSDHPHDVLYVLPVVAGNDLKWGDGLDEVRKLDVANRHGLICVAPSFSQLPWYADHPSDPAIRQESYLLKVVVPFVDRTYEPEGAGSRRRLLLGFSKSGCGAFTLLLRHPDLFHRAAAWDSPLMMDAPGKYGSGPIFGDARNFEGYCIPSLLRREGTKPGPDPRLIVLGYGNFQEPTRQAHELLTELRIPHEYRNEVHREHHWNTGWVEEAVELLITPSPEHGPAAEHKP